MENKSRIYKAGKPLSKATKKKTTADQKAETYLTIRNLAFASFNPTNSSLEKLLPDSGSESKKEFSRRLKGLDSSLSMDELRARVTKAEMLVEWYHHHLLIDKKFTALYKEVADAQFERRQLATMEQQKKRNKRLDEPKKQATEIYRKLKRKNLNNLKIFSSECKPLDIKDRTLKLWYDKLNSGMQIIKTSDKK